MHCKPLQWSPHVPYLQLRHNCLTTTSKDVINFPLMKKRFIKGSNLWSILLINQKCFQYNWYNCCHFCEYINLFPVESAEQLLYISINTYHLFPSNKLIYRWIQYLNIFYFNYWNLNQNLLKSMKSLQKVILYAKLY